MPEVGDTLGPYTLIRRIGAGGMGEVHLARDPRLDREVAIKILPEELRDDPERRQRFLREARAAAKLSHPHVTAIHEIGEAEGRDFIAFEYVEGRTLDALVRERPLPLNELIDVALPLADALGYAHERGVVHRDLKAANVIVSSRGHAKLLDFGLAKLLHGEVGEENKKTTTLTMQGAIFGTPHAMSPEQALGRSVDPRSDVFSFGSLLYEMAAGRAAFQGATVMEVMDAVIHAEPDDLTRLRADLPAEFAAIVAKALRKDPGERYQHMADLAADLKHFKRTTDSGLVPPGKAREAARGPLLAGGAAAALALALGLWWLLGRGGARPGAEDLAAAPIGVVGFENLSDPTDARHLGRMLMGLVTTDLSESGGLEVVSTARILSARRELGEEPAQGFDAALASEAAERAGARLMLVGQVAERGEGLLLTAELVDVRGGRTLDSWTHNVASEDELFELAGSLGDGVRARVGVSSAEVDGTIDLARALTDSAEAYRQFTTGEIALHELRFDDAARRFEQALKLDPSFALASFRLAMAYDWLNQGVRALAAYVAGLDHLDRLPERWQGIYRAALARVRDDYDLAYRELIALEDSASDVADWNNHLGEVYTHGNRYVDPIRARECFERALEADPTYKLVLFHLMQTCVLGEDLELAWRMVDRYRALDPEDPSVLAAEVTLLVASKREEEALRLLDQAGIDETSMFSLAIMTFLRNGDPARAELVADAAVDRHEGFVRTDAMNDRAFSRLASGRLQAVQRSLVEEAPFFDELSPSFRIGALARRASIRWALGIPEESIDELREGLEGDPWSCTGAFWLGASLCEAGMIDEAERVLADLEARAPEFVSPLVGFWKPLLASVVSLARGDLEAARSALGEAESVPVEYRDRGLAALFRARLETAAGDRPAAIAAYREILDPPRLRSSPAGARNQPWRPMEIPVHYELALLEEAEGELDAAREHYRSFLDYWGEADLPLPSIADARKRLARLEGR